MTTGPESPSRQQVWTMFDRIAHRYDLLNRLLSCGQDTVWRRRMTAALPPGPDLRVLDVATGTADVLLALFGSGRVGSGVGVDMSERMLEQARRKIAARGLEQRLDVRLGDATALKEPDAAYDVATIAFGIRNVTDTLQGLRELRRVLKPGGRALILEFSLPANALIRRGYLLYFRHVLPRLGGLISGDYSAYRYLNQTVETYPYGEAFMRLMRDAGFQNVTARPLTFGIATLYAGER